MQLSFRQRRFKYDCTMLVVLFMHNYRMRGLLKDKKTKHISKHVVNIQSHMPNPKKSGHSTSMMYNIFGKTEFNQAGHTNKNLWLSAGCKSEKCQNHKKIFAASKLAYSGEQQRGKPSVLLANTKAHMLRDLAKTSSNHCNEHEAMPAFTGITPKRMHETHMHEIHTIQLSKV